MLKNKYIPHHMYGLVSYPGLRPESCLLLAIQPANIVCHNAKNSQVFTQHVNSSERYLFGGTAFLNIRHKDTLSHGQVFSLDNHYAQAVLRLQSKNFNRKKLEEK